MNQAIESALRLDTMYQGTKHLLPTDLDSNTGFLHEVYHLIEKLAKNNSAEETEQCLDKATLLISLKEWEKTKTVYTIDPDFLDALQQTEDTEINTELFCRLPQTAFYVHNSKSDQPGYLVCIDKNDANQCMIAVTTIIPAAKKEEMRFYPRSCCLQNGMTIEQSARWMGNNILDKVPPEIDVSEDVREYINTVCLPERTMIAFKTGTQIAYYLASQNADIKSVKIAKKARPIRKNGKPLNVDTYQVGFYVGRDFKKLFSDSTTYTASNGTGTGKKKHPHVRRAHWHHYWCGEGRTRLEVRWIAPAPVNCNSENIPIVERKLS